MKILYIHNSAIDSRKANLLQVLSMCKAFSDNEINITLLIPNSDSKIKNIEGYVLKSYGIKVNFNIVFFKKNSLHKSIDKYFLNRKVEEIIKESDADYIFSRIPIYILASLKRGKKAIYESHNSKMHNKYFLMDYFFRLLIVSKSKKENFKLFITISNNLLKFWELQGVNNKKLLALHDGVCLDEFDIPKSKKSIRNLLGLPITKKIFIYTGSLYPDREIENILLLAKQLKQHFFCIVGGPDDNKDYYQKLSSKMGLTNTCFTGHIAHSMIPLYLRSADVLLALWSNKVPTINYCSPLKIFEYMASGTPIVAHNFPTIKEVLDHKKNALLVNYGDMEDLLNKSQYALLENDYGRNAREKVRLFTWDERVRKILNTISCNE